MRARVQTMTVGRGWRRAVKRAHHVGILHVQHNHGRGIAEGGELHATYRAVYRQALICYRTTPIPGWFREDVI